MRGLSRLNRFQAKAYRDGYLESRVRGFVATQIRAIRDRLKLSQTKFGERIGKPQAVVSRLEDPSYGGATVKTLLDVAKALDMALVVKFVSYPEFIRQTEDMSPAALVPQTIYQSLRAPPSVGTARPVGATVARIDTETPTWSPPRSAACTTYEQPYVH